MLYWLSIRGAVRLKMDSSRKNLSQSAYITKKSTIYDIIAEMTQTIGVFQQS